MVLLNVTNNSALNRFELPINGELGTLDYCIENDTIFLKYVEVPPSARGKGFAAILCKAALDLTAERKLKAVIYCPYIAGFAARHPEYSHLIR